MSHDFVKSASEGYFTQNKAVDSLSPRGKEFLTNSESKYWVNDKVQYHREDGPAIEKTNGEKHWYVNGKNHRLDGPAVERANGDKEWWVDGEEYSEEEFNKKIAEMNKSEDKDEPTKIDRFGTKYWKNDKGQLHREDGPAVEYADGSKWWYLNGKLHREDGPAYEGANGDKEWYLNNKLHREDGPAIEFSNGRKEWWVNGKCHREDGPAVECAYGHNNRWYIRGVWFSKENFDKKIAEMKNSNKTLSTSKFHTNDKGEYHREDGPAIEWDNGVKSWWINGKHHREDGPAIEWPDGTKYWALDGVFMSESEHKELLLKKSLEPQSFYKILESSKEDPYAHFDGEKFTRRVLHREDGPALINSLGDKFWYIDGKCHRDNGPAAEFSTGAVQYYKHGKLHRTDGPAIIMSDKCCSYYVNGKLHSLEHKADGKDYYLYGQVLTEREFSWFRKLPNILSISTEEFFQLYNIMHPLKNLEEFDIKRLIFIISEMLSK